MNELQKAIVNLRICFSEGIVTDGERDLNVYRDAEILLREYDRLATDPLGRADALVYEFVQRSPRRDISKPFAPAKIRQRIFDFLSGENQTDSVKG